MRQIALLGLACVTLSACSPRSALDKVIESKSFIPYELPMPSTRVGTMLHGNNNELYLVATPDQCFPDLSNGQSLRWVQPTDLPSEYQSLQFKFNATVNPILSAGNPILNFNVDASYVKTVSIQFQNPEIEYLNESVFRNTYMAGMSSGCKALLAEYPFIVQGLRIDSMSFVFKDSAGANINLSGLLGQIVNIAPGVSYQVENDYSLVITTPKYIGYRMARLNPQTLKLLYASRVDPKGNWIFKDVDHPYAMDSMTFLTQSVNMAHPAEPLSLFGPGRF